MVAIKEWVYDKLSASSALLAMIGDTDRIIDAWPEAVTTFPLVIYIDENQENKEYADNKPLMSGVRFAVHIFVKIDGSYTSSAIGSVIETLFTDEFYHCGINGEVQDPTEGVRHRVMKFSRALFPSDI